ncbi:MAG TPA: beta-hydroxyacyl-ACP dehydratase [Smithellaceae bacterium]|nr:beta-hydroxyacyl-ACP dehydratase [Smithellaceae bacterium]HNT90459.1 beta-hydroxyacyl-ACP dehydratase [Smithellaceae bacterium]HNV63697.1 beta-hydroxyacyl-ACP dehydratase [Smithellaceae bacterium]HNZ31335.1 beta-hydroxyacyl-ACP dehydratase [Smithellaceae bacterium]HOD30873.1 beta-hydroxyacyl-ACP dehydratase [Smithellaceae bacterium]
MEVNEELKKEILSLVPQQAPFRFIDEIISLDEEKITGAYRFKEDEFFYLGHFPSRPITPGVILIETMAQIGATAFGIYLMACQKKMRPSEMDKALSLFSSVDGVEFKGIVAPGERVIVKGNKNYFRKGVLKVETTMERENGEIICWGTLMGVVANL